MVEKKNGVVPVSKKVAASVLAGIMATGMVPAAAFAEGTAIDMSSDSNVELQAEDVESQAADDVELQALPADKAFGAAKVTTDPVIPAAGFDPKNLPTDTLKTVKVEIDPKTSLELAYDKESGKLYNKKDFEKTNKKDLYYSISYKNDSDATVSEDTVRNNAGKYKLVITAIDGKYKGGINSKIEFNIKANPGNENIPIEDAAYNKTSGDKKFTYNAEPQKIAFKRTDTGTFLDDNQYVVQYFKKGADPADPTQALPSTPVDAGEYLAKLTPRDGANFKIAPIEFKIEKLDLSKTDLGAQFSTSIVVGADTPINSKVQLVSVNGSTGLASKLQAVDWIKEPEDPKGKDLGRYKAKLTAKDPADQNFERDANGIKTGVSENVVYRVAHATSMEYNGNPMDGQVVNIDQSMSQTWSKNNIKARDEHGVVQTPTDFVIVDVATGKKVNDITNLNDGSYIVTALWHNVDPAKPENNYTYGAAATMKVTTSQKSVDADTNAVVTFKQQKDGDPVVTNAIKTTYDGTDIIKRIGYSIKKDATHYLEEGPDKDFTVDFTDSKGNVVTSIKDAGNYTLTFKSKKYHIKNPSVPITIESAKIQAIMPFRIDPKTKEAKAIEADSIGNGQSSVVVAPGEVFIRYNDGEKNTNGDLVWKDLPVDAVVKITNSKGEEVNKFDKADTYKISVDRKRHV